MVLTWSSRFQDWLFMNNSSVLESIGHLLYKLPIHLVRAARFWGSTSFAFVFDIHYFDLFNVSTFSLFCACALHVLWLYFSIWLFTSANISFSWATLHYMYHNKTCLMHFKCTSWENIPLNTKLLNKFQRPFPLYFFLAYYAI